MAKKPEAPLDGGQKEEIKEPLEGEQQEPEAPLDGEDKQVFDDIDRALQEIEGVKVPTKALDSNPVVAPLGESKSVEFKAEVKRGETTQRGTMTVIRN